MRDTGLIWQNSIGYEFISPTIPFLKYFSDSLPIYRQHFYTKRELFAKLSTYSHAATDIPTKPHLLLQADRG